MLKAAIISLLMSVNLSAAKAVQKYATLMLLRFPLTGRSIYEIGHIGHRLRKQQIGSNNLAENFEKL